MKKIETSEQLKLEIARLEGRAKEQEENLRESLRDLREQYRPENMALNALSSITGININKSEFLKNGIAMGLSLVLQRFVFKTEKNVERKIYSWIDELFDKIKNLLNKFSSMGSTGSEKIEEKD
ncbi:MAG: hypothetical protein U0073_04940 [Bacteroidia bacterium]